MPEVTNVEFELEFESGNAAILDAPRSAVAKILRDLAELIENGRDCGVIKDVNGNTIGDFHLHLEEKFDLELMRPVSSRAPTNFGERVMGFFSWKTADDNQSIANVHSGRPIKTVYLIQPNGEPPIEERAYQGYGVFGGVDAYEWLAKKNFGEGASRNTGILADCGHYHSDAENIYLCSLHITEEQFRQAVTTDKPVVMFNTYGQKMSNGQTPNELIESFAWTKNRIPLKFPLKFSLDPKAKYEDLPASRRCPYQGFFFEF